MKIRPYHKDDQASVIALWKLCGLTVSWNDPAEDIERKMKVNPDLFLIGEKDGKVIATAMAGYEGHRGWINYLAVSPDHRRKHYGRLIMQAAEEKLKEKGCPKLNLQIRKNNKKALEFYQALGFTDDEVTSLGKRLI